MWRDDMGIPMWKVTAVLNALTGVHVMQGALTQDALQHAEVPLGTAYECLRATVPEAPVVHADDTGWRVGAEPS